MLKRQTGTFDPSMCGKLIFTTIWVGSRMKKALRCETATIGNYIGEYSTKLYSVCTYFQPQLKVLDPRIVETYLPIINEKTKKFIGKLERSNDTMMNSTKSLSEFTTDTIAAISQFFLNHRGDWITLSGFGIESGMMDGNPEAEEFYRHSRVFFEILSNSDYPLPPEKRWFSPKRNRADASIQYMRKLGLSIIQNHRKSPSEATKNSLIGLLCDAKDDETGVALADEKILSDITDTINAGTGKHNWNCQIYIYITTDTTSVSLNYTLYCLSKHPEALRNIREELNSILGEGTNCPTLHAEQLQKMKYMEATMKEVMRIMSPVPLNARMSSKESIVSGYRVPAGIINFNLLWNVKHFLFYRLRRLDKHNKNTHETWFLG
jgi:cytochrome P450